MTVLKLVQGLVRPTVTWLGFGSVIVLMYLRYDIPEWYQILIGVIVGFWFGQRGKTEE
jgi:hypothetical protein